MAETWLGETLVLVGKRRIYSVSGGPQTVLIYEGSHEAVASAEGKLSGVDYEVDYSTGEPKAILTVTTADYGESDPTPPEQIVTTYELTNNSAQRSILEHPRAVRLGATALADIRTKMRGTTSGGETVIRSAAANGFTGDKATVYDMLVAGQDAFLISQWVFKVNQVITRNSQAFIAQAGLNTIYNRAKIIQEVGPGSPWEGLMTSAESNLTAFYGTIPDGYTLGWLKMNFSLTNISNNRAAVSLEYGLEAWSTFSYPTNFA